LLLIIAGEVTAELVAAEIDTFDCHLHERVLATTAKRRHEERDARSADLVRGLRDCRGEITKIGNREIVSRSRTHHDHALRRQLALRVERQNLADFSVEGFLLRDFCEMSTERLVCRFENSIL